MKSQLNILLGGLGLFALQGCKTPQAEQAQQPNVIYVFPDQFRNCLLYTSPSPRD